MPRLPNDDGCIRRPPAVLSSQQFCCPPHGCARHASTTLAQEAGQGVTKEVPIPSAGSSLRPADLLITNWSNGRDTAVEITVCHGWQLGEQRTHTNAAQVQVSRERWTSFLRRKEEDKHNKYDITCSVARWSFGAMAFGTWGGVGPECAKTLQRITKRAASWQEGDLRASKLEQARLEVGWALMTKVLNNKNYLR